MATTTTSGATRLRVRVLFADEVGRHVLRHRGFSGCWFLVPSDARIVGDLAYALVQEFDLAARCPAGVDLAIDGLHVPANQDICVVRDNDAVAVQCASSLEPLQSPAPKRRRRYLEAEDTGSLSIPLSPSLSSEDDDGGEEGEEAGLRRMMQHLRSQRLSLQRKGKAPKKTKEAKATKQFKIKTAAVSKPGKDKLKKKATLVTTKQSESSSDSDSDSDSSSSGSSSSDSSSDSSSSSSSEEDTTSTNGGAKKAVSVKRTPNSSQSGKGAQPKRPPTSGDGAKAAKVADADNNDEQKPRRQRRRQRRRRRDRNGNVNAVQEGASNGLVAAPDAGEAGGAVAETSSAPTVAEPRREIRTRFPQSKAHFRFDGANGEAIAASHPSDGSSNHRQTPAGLEKYGPSSSDGVMANGGSNSGEAANSHARHANGANEGQRRRRQPGGDAANASEGGNGFAPQRKKAKTHRDEMWKRPYEVLATVLDKPQDDAATSKADLTALLAVYPSPSAGDLNASSFQSDDVVAFKTLRLCMETWQPIVSDWQCGRVVAVDAGAGVTLGMRKLTVSDDSSEPSVRFDSPLVGDDATKEFPVGEFSELRYLSGPTFEALRKAPSADAGEQ